MSAPTRYIDAPQASPSAVRSLRLRLKPAHQRSGFVQGAWWPRSTQLLTELPPLMAALSLRLGRIKRVVYDENNWAPASLRMEFRGCSVILEGLSDQSPNTVSVIGEQFGRLVLLVVPPDTDPTRAYTMVMTAARPDDVSTADELLGIGAQEGEHRRPALMAHQRCQSDGGALRRGGHGRGGPAASAGGQEA
jgi:hypothetical protein